MRFCCGDDVQITSTLLDEHPITTDFGYVHDTNWGMPAVASIRMPLAGYSATNQTVVEFRR